MTRGRSIEKLAQVLRDARTEKGLSARELAEEIGVHHTTIALLERGDIEQPKAVKLHRLAEALGLDATDLLALAGYQPTDKLPAFGVYLRTTTRLPDQAIEELHGHFEYLRAKYGANGDGPKHGEDETDEH